MLFQIIRILFIWGNYEQHDIRLVRHSSGSIACKSRSADETVDRLLSARMDLRRYIVKIFVDVETTGFDPWRDSVLSLACVLTDDNGNTIDTFYEFCRPATTNKTVTLYTEKNGRIVPYERDLWSEKAAKIHGISYEQAMKQQHPINLCVNFLNFLAKRVGAPTPLTMYTKNMAFDLRMITAMMYRNLEHHAYKMYRYVDFRNWENVYDMVPNATELAIVAKREGIDINAHDALSDVTAMIELWKRYSVKAAA